MQSSADEAALDCILDFFIIIEYYLAHNIH